MTKRKRPDCLACEAVGTRSRLGVGARIGYDPGVQMPGSPTIEGRGLSAEQMARLYYEEGLDGVVPDWALTHEELVMACWWAAHWGPRKLQKAWREWGYLAGWHLRYHCISIPLPPMRIRD